MTQDEEGESGQVRSWGSRIAQKHIYASILENYWTYMFFVLYILYIYIYIQNIVLKACLISLALLVYYNSIRLLRCIPENQMNQKKQNLDRLNIYVEMLIVFCTTKFSIIMMSLAPAKVYLASSPEIPIGTWRLPAAIAGCSVGAYFSQWSQYSVTSWVFQETFLFSWALGGGGELKGYIFKYVNIYMY